MSRINSELRHVDIKRLKQWAQVYLKETSPLRSVLTLEKDKLTYDEFLAKMETWLKLAVSEEFTSKPGRVILG